MRLSGLCGPMVAKEIPAGTPWTANLGAVTASALARLHPCRPAVEVGLPRFLDLAGDAVGERVHRADHANAAEEQQEPHVLPEGAQETAQMGPDEKGAHVQQHRGRDRTAQ